MYSEINFDNIDINAAPPAEEPARQYYYMAKCRELVREFELKNARRPTAFTQTFGCQVNTVHEIEKSRINAAFCVRV